MTRYFLLTGGPIIDLSSQTCNPRARTKKKIHTGSSCVMCEQFYSPLFTNLINARTSMSVFQQPFISSYVQIKCVCFEMKSIFSSIVHQVQYSLDGSTWQTVANENGTDVVFVGNRDMNSQALNPLPAPITARYIRLRPVTWNVHISLRWDVRGCSMAREFD